MLSYLKGRSMNKQLLMLFLTTLITISCFAGYNPEGFTCTVSNFSFPDFPGGVTIKMTNPPLYMHRPQLVPCLLYPERNDIKGRVAPAQIRDHLKSLEFTFVERNTDDTDHVICTIVSEYVTTSVDVRGMQFPFLRYDGEPKMFESHQNMLTLSLSDFFESSVYADFPLAFGARVYFKWYDALKLIVEMINWLSASQYGPEIFIDEYVLQ